ncbi:MAG: hypothetical protein IJJ44_11080 [Solobacterium sp.]|nr:hypothetical protein [Solobacterium sp.]
MLTLCLYGCGTKYTVDYCGQKDTYTGAKESYLAGKNVTLYYSVIGTDTDYSFTLDGEPLNCLYEEGKGYAVRFTMPAHDVRLECRMYNSMLPTTIVSPELWYSTVTVYANYSEDGAIMREALNGEMMIISSVQHLPVYLLENTQDLEWFKTGPGNSLSLDQSHDEVPSFNEVTGNYNEEFFRDHSLLLAYVQASSGSFRYELNYLEKADDKLVMHIIRTNDPEVYTADMSGWLVLAEVNKEEIKDCAGYDAQMDR